MKSCTRSWDVFKRFLRKTHRTRLIFWFGLALLLRFILFQRLPAILTLDSIDYIHSAADILQNKELYPATLGDWRLPTYPIFLAVTWYFTRFQSQNIVLVQSVLGMFIMFCGYRIGQKLRSRLLAEMLVVFLGLNPVFMLNEHSIMSESLFLFALILVTLLVFHFLVSPVGLIEGGCFGAATSFCLLTRFNSVLFLFALVTGLLICHLRSVNNREQITARKSYYAFWLGFLVLIFSTVGSWTWRNYQEMGQLTPFTSNVNRNRLIYLIQHNLVDPTLPAFMTKFKYSEEALFDANRFVRNLNSDTLLAEELAGKLISEQIIDHPFLYLQTAVEAGFRFGGLRFPGSQPTGSHDVYSWFNFIVADIQMLDQINSAYVFDSQRIPFRYNSISQSTNATKALSFFGTKYFEVVRPVMFILSICLLFWTFITRNNSHKTSWFYQRELHILALGYALTLVFHAASLADYDRFAVPFDWILIAIISIGFSKQCKYSI